MEPHILSGKTQQSRRISRAIALIAPLIFCSLNASAQVQTCTTSATPVNIHAEGQAERLGDLTITCTGGTAGAAASVNLFIGLNVNVTNQFGVAGGIPTVAVTNGGVPISTSATVASAGAQGVSILGLNYNLPPSGLSTVVTLSGLRGAASMLPAGAVAILATVGGTGVNIVFNSLLAVGVPNASLLTSVSSNALPCAGSPLPVAPVDLVGLINAGTSETTLRVTEGFLNAFAKKDASSTNGVRIVVSISGYPANARIFVPDVVVGNSGSSATSSGEFGIPAQPGSYTPGTVLGQLLMARVDSADSNGAGGLPVASVPTVSTIYSGVTEIPLVNGAATISYEVLDSYPGGRETALIPVYAVVPASTCGNAVTVPNVSAKIGPVSNVTTADTTSPVPRFQSVTAQSDCTVLNDCGAAYFPALQVDTTPVTLNGSSFGSVQTGFIRVGNSGNGTLSFTASITYPAGSVTGWLKVSPTSGNNSTTLVLTADPGALQPGIYTAVVTVNAAQYGMQSVSVTFTVGQAGITIQSIVNAATFVRGGPLTAGSIAALYGINLTGQRLGVSFDGFPATVFGVYPLNGNTQQQINLQVPPGLGTRTSANVVVSVDGQVSNTFPVSLVPNSPGIFSPGIENQDFTVNSATAPAKLGSVISFYMTGLTLPLTGQVTVKIGDLDFLIPQYAGQAPTLTGVQQVNVFIPVPLTFTGNSAPIQACIPALDPTQRICSPASTLYVTR